MYNGNISQTFWKTANTDTGLKNYNYTYDALNRLTAATDNTSLTPNRYNESLSYDKNGNIMSLLRMGNTDANATIFGTMDNLVYTYDGGNKLTKVEDSSGSTEGFKNGSNSPTEYAYDANGNMTLDLNKGISSITYNYLNLPTQVVMTGGTINYVYDATGVKQQKIVNGITTDYAGGFNYEGGLMKFFSQPEGYVANNNGIFSYIYQYKDHLGNVRLSYGDANNDGVVNSSEIVEENNYYPFGLKQKGYNYVTAYGNGNPQGQKYKYNGKEYQDELGLNMYDYGARNFDPALGRWMNIDPKAELLEKSSPYVYALNCPVIYLDKDGELPILINGRVGSDDERATEKYWTSEIVATIQGSGIANPGGQIHYVDGDRYYNTTGTYNSVIDYDVTSNISNGIQKGGYFDGNDPSERKSAGRMAMTNSEFKIILSKLERNSQGKIIEKIQIYTHSRGAAFGEGYTERLMELIKANSEEFIDAENEVEFSYNMGTHQSWGVSAVKGVPTFSDDHSQDDLSGNRMSGAKGAFTSDQGKGTRGAHSIKSFNKDLKAFTSAFLKGGSSKDVISSFVKTMKDKYNITVTVK